MHIRLETNETEASSRGPTRSFDVRETLAALARPRLTGSDEAAAVLADLRNRFMRFGYEVTDLPFEFSAWPGRFGLSVIGGIYALGSLFAAGLLSAGHPGIALVLLLM